MAIKCIMKKNLSRLPDLLSKEISILRVQCCYCCIELFATFSLEIWHIQLLCTRDVHGNGIAMGIPMGMGTQICQKWEWEEYT